MTAREMEYRRLGGSGPRVSAVCLGTMTFGQQNGEAEAHSQLDLAVERGIDFIDTAEMYPVPARAETSGETERIVARLHGWIDDPQVDCIITTGGTGVTGRDVTPEALRLVQDKEIPGFGELFRWLSYEKIGNSTIQSRACACVSRGTYIFALPGSTGAVKDGWDGILVHQLDSRFRPCNFVELMPRLRER